MNTPNVIPLPGVPDRNAWPWNALEARAARVGKSVRHRGPSAAADEIRTTSNDPRDLLKAIRKIERAA